MGEVTKAQLHSPEIVIGYIRVFDVAEDTFAPKARIDVVRALSRACDLVVRPKTSLVDDRDR